MKKIIKNEKFIDFLKYTISFIIIMGFICFIFKRNGMNFIWCFDGYTQHFVTLTYFKNILSNLSLNTFTWNIGFGMDMFSNLAYYVFGDLVSYFSVLVPQHLLKYFYSISIVIRLYLAGLSFLWYCHYRNQKGAKVIIGSIVYIFCGYALIASVRHPYFVNAMTIFPISMIGIEKYINENKKPFYIFSVFLMFVNSFYFGYMNALTVGIYGIILAISKYKKDYKKILSVLWGGVTYAFIGLLMSCFVLAPTINEFLNSARTSLTADITYNFNYYRNLIRIISNFDLGINHWSYINVSAIVFLVIPLIIKNRKKELPLTILGAILFLPFISSTCSSIISGLNYSNNRYTFMFVFVISYLSVTVLKENSNIDIKTMLIILFGYLFLTLVLELPVTASTISFVAVLLLMMLVFLYKDKFKFRKKSYFIEVLAVIVILNTMFNCYYLYDPKYNNYVYEFTENYQTEALYDSAHGYYDNFSQAIDYIKSTDKGFYNIGKNVNDAWNLGLYKNYNSINYYYSIVSNLYNDLATDLNNKEKEINLEIKEFDNRAKINSLLGKKYFITNNPQINMYGFDSIKKLGNTYIYKNKNTVDFASLYNKCINTKVYDKLTDLEKEDALLKYYVSDNCSNQDYTLDNIKPIKYKSSIPLKKHLVLNSSTGNKVTLKLNKPITGELYVKINNLQYKNLDLEERINAVSPRKVDRNKYKSEIKWENKEKNIIVKAHTKNMTNEETIFNKKHTYYLPNEDILINLGYYDNYKGKVTLSFSELGIYDFDSINIYEVPFNNYEENINNLNKSNFELKDYGDNYLKGTVNPETDGVLTFRTLFNKGWTVLVDGKKVKTFNNKYFLSINIEKGKHDISLQYKTPFIKEGLIISCIGWILFISVIILSNKKIKIKHS